MCYMLHAHAHQGCVVCLMNEGSQGLKDMWAGEDMCMLQGHESSIESEAISKGE